MLPKQELEVIIRLDLYYKAPIGSKDRVDSDRNYGTWIGTKEASRPNRIERAYPSSQTKQSSSYKGQNPAITKQDRGIAFHQSPLDDLNQWERTKARPVGLTSSRIRMQVNMSLSMSSRIQKEERQGSRRLNSYSKSSISAMQKFRMLLFRERVGRSLSFMRRGLIA